MNELFGKHSGANREDFGVTHADDLLFIFKDVMGMTNAIRTWEDKKVADQMTTMWTNFAKHQNPTPSQSTGLVTWKPFNVRTCSIPQLPQ